MKINRIKRIRNMYNFSDEKSSFYLKHSNKSLKPITYLILLIFMILIILPLTPTASAGGQDATFDSVKAKAVPSMQGIGGEVRIEALADFYGGCCYHLYANDVKAELKVPENIRIVSPPPKTIAEVDAVPGGKATSQKFQWSIVGDSPGIYELEVIVSTSNSGTESTKVQVTIVEGVSISIPSIHPPKPSVDEAISFLVDVKSGNERVTIIQASLYIWRSTKDFSEEKLKAEKEKLFIEIGRSIDTLQTIDNNNVTNNNTGANASTGPNESTQYKLLGVGKGYSLSHGQFTDTWRTRLNDFKNEENIYYWVNVETSDGENVSHAIYKLQIEDLEKKFQMVELTIWSTFIITTLGIILILGIIWSVYGRINKDLGKSGIFVLGSSTYTKPSEGTRINVSKLSIENFRVILVILVFAIAIILVIVSIYLGLLDTLIDVTSGT